MLETKKKKLKEKLEKANISLDDEEEDEDLVMIAICMEDLALKGLDEVRELSHLFIADSGASVHMTGSSAGMINVRDCDIQVKIANGGMAKATKVGDKRCYVKDKEGKKNYFTLANCKYVPDLGSLNLCSLTKGIESGCNLGNTGKFITMKKGNFELMFDKEVKTRSDYVCAVKVYFDKDEESVATALEDDYDEELLPTQHRHIFHLSLPLTSLTN